MKITIEVMGWLKKFTKGKTSLELDVSPGTKAGDVIDMTGVPVSETGFISVSSAKADSDRLVGFDYILCEGDTLKLYSHIVGG